MYRPALPLPTVRYVAAPLCAGFPSPAEDYAEGPVDLNRLLAPGGRQIVHAWRDARGGPVVHVLDPAASARAGDLVLARIDGRARLARVRAAAGATILADGSGRPIAGDDAVLVGVATWRLRPFREPDAAGWEDVGPGVAAWPEGLSCAGATAFLFRVSGRSMRDAGIDHRDLLLVDRGLTPRDGDVVVAAHGPARSVKRLFVEGGRARLAFDNAEDFPDPPPFHPETTVFGVATWGLRRLRRR